jgi:hypothetical protein
MEPQDPFTQPIPLTLHVTDALELPLTWAENCCCPLVASTTWIGDTETETVEGDEMVTVELAETVTSAREVTVTNTVDGAGAIAGAL